MERSLRFKIATLGTFAALLLTACHGGGFSPADEMIGIGPSLTGGKTDDGLDVTTASDDGEIESLKSRIDTSEANLNLAKGIIGLSVTLVDKNGKTVSANPERLKIEIYLKPGIAEKQTLAFDAPLTNQRDKKIFKNISAEDKQAFRVSGACGASDCKKVVLRLERTGLTEKGEAGLIFRSRTVKGQGGEDPTDYKTAAHLREVNRSLQANKVDGSLTTMEVAYGLSNFKMEVTTQSQKLCITGRYVLTTGHDERVNLSSCDGQNPNITATMIGNDGGGTIVLRLDEEGEDLSLLLLADDDDLLNQDPGGPGTTPIISGDIRLPVDANSAVTLAMNKDRNRPEVKKRMQAVWLSQGLNDIRQWLTRIQPNLPVLSKGLNSHGVPNQFIVITLTESAFFKTAGYPVQVSAAQDSTATGPWQVVGRTAPELGLKIFPNQVLRVVGKGKSKRYIRDFNKCDERAYLKESTLAAGKYFARFLRSFNDFKLAVLSYHDGQHRTNEFLECAKKGSKVCTVNGKKKTLTASRLKLAKDMNLDFWKLHTLGMLDQVSSNYVLDFVAANLIAMNPGSYGVAPPSYQSIGSPAPAPVKPATCN